MIRNERGQTLLISVIALLLAVSITTPALIKWMNDESLWSVKTLQNTRAAQMAELGLDLGFQQLIQSSTTWNAALSGAILPGFNFDLVYTDVALGSYAVKISSGPGRQQATIIAVGREKLKKEIWGIKMVVQNTVAQTALYTGHTLTLKNNATVEWGPVVAVGAILTDASHLHPRFICDGMVDPFDTTAEVPNTDNTQWWSYQAYLPPAPQIDIDSYIGAAKAGGVGHYNSGLPTYTPNLGTTTGTYYFDGDVILDPANPLFLQGNLIVKGNLTILGTVGTGTVNLQVPDTAWMEYGNDWATYQAWDGSAPGSFPGTASLYAPTGLPNVTLNQVAVHGFTYVEGQIVLNDLAGAQIPFVGSMYVGGTTVLSPTLTTLSLHFDPNVAAQVKTRNVPLARHRWENLSTCRWSGAFPVCL